MTHPPGQAHPPHVATVNFKSQVYTARNPCQDAMPMDCTAVTLIPGRRARSMNVIDR